MWQDLKNVYHLCIAILAILWYGFPSRKLTVIGVTGTDGKTTTVSLVYHILKSSGRKVSMVSSVGAYISDKHYDVGFHVTNPSSFPLQKFLRQSAQAGDYLVLEVTSHGLDQYRVFGINFAIGVITNVTREHLDYHGSYENYLLTKAKLLNLAKTAIINIDDEAYLMLRSNFRDKHKKLITYGLNSDADVNPLSFPFQTKLNGKFNTYNILAAVCVCKALGVPSREIKNAIASFKPPIGRGDIVYDKEFTVMIDFAHTPNAFEQLLSGLKTKGRLIHVFGCAGERDKTKRAKMGEFSSVYSDLIILTAEDPRSESVESINREIAAGIRDFKFNSKNLFSISDRRSAINKAIGLAKKGDFVLLTGKGHEKSMNYGRGEEPWSEYEAVKNALGDRNLR